MPATAAHLLTLLLAFSAQVLFVAASPVIWYLAPTSSSTPAFPTKAPTSASSVVWYKADPTTSKKPSSSSATAASGFSTIWYKAPPPSSSAPPATPSQTFTFPSPLLSGNLYSNGGTTYRGPAGTPPPRTQWTSNSTAWEYTPSEVCPEETLKGVLRPGVETEVKGVSLAEVFYAKHGGLLPFCGRQLQLFNPSNHSQSLNFTVTRGCARQDCQGDGIGVHFLQRAKIQFEFWRMTRRNGVSPAIEYRLL